jgi:L-ascorbate metabolism protein UlaG (beta-lactamase superfamily)
MRNRTSHPAFTAAEPTPLPWPDGEPVGGSITWTGVAGVVLDVDGTRVAVDPFATRPGLLDVLLRPAASDEGLVAQTFPEVDAVFIGHAHYDHLMDVPAVVAASPSAVVHGSATAIELCRRAGVDEERLRVVGDGDRVTFGPFRVEVIAAAHGVVPVFRHLDPGDLPVEGLPASPIRWPCGPVLAYRIEVGGRAFHLHGSAGIDGAALARQRPADVLLACIAARQGTPAYLARLGAALRPRLLIPTHHDDFTKPLAAAPRPVPRLDWDGFLEDAAALRREHGTRLHLLPRAAPVAV